jgi:hypothetical protein
MKGRFGLYLALAALLPAVACKSGLDHQLGCLNESKPPGRLVGAMAIDSANYQAVLFGGIGKDRVHYDDVWALSLEDYHWEMLDVAGRSPGGLSRHAMVYDSPNRRMLVFAGNAAVGTLFNDVWALYLTPGREHWEKLAPTGPLPEPRTLPAAVYCPTRHSMIVYGGATVDSGTGTVFELCLDKLVWRELAARGRKPHARCSAGAFYDAHTNSMVIFGGVWNDFYNDAWALDLTPGEEHWDSLPTTGTPPDVRAGFASGYVADVRKFYVTAGWGSSCSPQYAYVLDMRTLAWSESLPPGPVPVWRRNPACALDEFNGNLLVFSGDGTGGWDPVEDNTPYLQVVGGLEWHAGPGREPPSFADPRTQH